MVGSRAEEGEKKKGRFGSAGGWGYRYLVKIRGDLPWTLKKEKKKG